MDDILLTFFILCISVFIAAAGVVALLLWRVLLWGKRIYAVLNRPY